MTHPPRTIRNDTAAEETHTTQRAAEKAAAKPRAALTPEPPYAHSTLLTQHGTMSFQHIIITYAT